MLDDDETRISLDLLPPRMLVADSGAPDEGRLSTLEEQEKAHILKALEQAKGNQSEMARLLDCGRGKIARKLLRYGIANPWAK